MPKVFARTANSIAGLSLLGGVVLGFGSLVLVLPFPDSITGFTLQFVAVSAMAAWVATSSPRLAYAGHNTAERSGALDEGSDDSVIESLDDRQRPCLQKEFRANRKAKCDAARPDGVIDPLHSIFSAARS